MTTKVGQKLTQIKQTAAELAAGVTPVNLEYEPGNVLRYGTNTTPGTTDMTAAFQAAVNSNKYVWSPTNNYAIDGTVTLPLTGIQIDFQKSTITDGDPTTTHNMFDIASDNAYLTIRNGRFTSTGVLTTYFNHTQTANCYDVLFNDCKFTNGSTPIYMRHLRQSTISNCSFIESATGLRVENSQDLKVIDNYFQGSGAAGSMTTAINVSAIASGEANRIIVARNTINNTGDTSLFARCFAGSNIHDVVISENIIKNAGKAAIKFTSPAGNDPAILYNCVISNNVIKGWSVNASTGAIAVFRDASDAGSTIDNVAITGNVIDGVSTSVSTSTAPGIRVSYVTNLVCNGNTVQNSYGNGMSIIQSNHVSLVGNTISGSGINFVAQDDTSAGMYLSGVDNFIYDSVVEGTLYQDGVVVYVCHYGKVSGVAKNNAYAGYYLQSTGGDRTSDLTCDFLSTGNTLSDIRYTSGSPILANVSYGNVVLSDGYIGIGDTAKRDTWFTNIISLGFQYYNTETDSIDVYAAANTWESIPLTASATIGISTPQTTTAALVDITNDVNTNAAKVEGSCYFNITTNAPVWSTGNADGSTWVDATGSTAHTPV